MATLNFDPNPQIGDTYTENGVTYQWDGTKWTATGGEPSTSLDDRYVEVAGDTMTGGLIAPELTSSGDITATGDLSAAAGRFSNTTTIGGTVASPNITLNAVGTGIFTNTVSVGESRSTSQAGGVSLSHSGVVTTYVPPQDYSTGSPFGTGSAGFQVLSRDITEGAGDLYTTAQWRGDGTIRIGDLTDSQSANLFLRANGDIETQRGLITSGSLGHRFNRTTSAQQWDIITSDSGIGFLGIYDRTNSRYAIRWYDNGTSGFSGTVSVENLELATAADNPSNFSVDQEYTGPTLNVKDRLVDALARIEALEAANTSLEARVTALGG